MLYPLLLELEAGMHQLYPLLEELVGQYPLLEEAPAQPLLLDDAAPQEAYGAHAKNPTA